MTYWKKLAIAALLLGGSACAGMMAEQAKSISSGYIGCPSKEVVITDVQFHMGATTWVASCRGTQMTCSREPAQDGRNGLTHCAPEIPKPAP